MMHTAAWDTEVDLRDKVVAVIGSGSSAIQVVPNIQPSKSSGLITEFISKHGQNRCQKVAQLCPVASLAYTGILGQECRT